MNEDKKLYELQDKIIENVKKNYKDYKCYKVDEIYSSEGLLNEQGYVVVPPYSVALTSQDRPDLLGVTGFPDVKIIPSMEIEDKDDVDISEEQARFEAVIRKLSQPMLGLENKQYDGLER